MPDNPARIAVLVLFREKPEQTIECIRSFSGTPAKIYLLNNASNTKSTRKVSKALSRMDEVHLIHSQVNLGPARGRNLLINHTSEDWVFLVDNDITIQPYKEWFGLMLKEIRNSPDVNVFLPRLFNVHENANANHPVFSLDGKKILINHGNCDLINYFPSGAALIHRNVFEKMGLFDEKLFAFEDYEFTIRSLLREEFQIVAKPISSVLLNHDHRRARNRLDRSIVRERYNHDNLEKNMKHILLKHNIRLEHDWQWWSKKQLHEMTGVPLWKKAYKQLRSMTKTKP